MTLGAISFGRCIGGRVFRSIRAVSRHFYSPTMRDLIDPRHPFDWWRARKTRELVDFEVLDESATQNSDSLIGGILKSGKPALIGRLGASEARFIGECLKLARWEKLGISRDVGKCFHPRWKPRLREIDNGTGFLVGDWDSFDAFTEQYMGALCSTDVLGAWGTAFAWPERIALRNMNAPNLVRVEHTSPWITPRVSGAVSNALVDTPREAWSMSLTGKRVVVVSPFDETIRTQFEIRHKLFTNHSYPEFYLRLVKSPWITHKTVRAGHGWQWHLDRLKHEMASEPFDVALISAGALAYPLAHHAKILGNVGIHAGGALQLFFGILGRRWETRPGLMAFVNEHWTRPSTSETPPNALALDDGCYW